LDDIASRVALELGELSVGRTSLPDQFYTHQASRSRPGNLQLPDALSLRP